MVNTLKQLGKGELGIINATLYTTPTSTTTIVKSIVLANKTATDATATITFDGANIVPTHIVPANDSIVIQLTAVLEQNMLIEGLAGTVTAIDYYISGIEVA